MIISYFLLLLLAMAKPRSPVETMTEYSPIDIPSLLPASFDPMQVQQAQDVFAKRFDEGFVQTSFRLKSKNDTLINEKGNASVNAGPMEGDIDNSEMGDSIPNFPKEITSAPPAKETKESALDIVLNSSSTSNATESSKNKSTEPKSQPSEEFSRALQELKSILPSTVTVPYSWDSAFIEEMVSKVQTLQGELKQTLVDTESTRIKWKDQFRKKAKFQSKIAELQKEKASFLKASAEQQTSVASLESFDKKLIDLHSSLSNLKSAFSSNINEASTSRDEVEADQKKVAIEITKLEKEKAKIESLMKDESESLSSALSKLRFSQEKSTSLSNSLENGKTELSQLNNLVAELTAVKSSLVSQLTSKTHELAAEDAKFEASKAGTIANQEQSKLLTSLVNTAAKDKEAIENQLKETEQRIADEDYSSKKEQLEFDSKKAEIENRIESLKVKLEEEGRRLDEQLKTEIEMEERQRKRLNRLQEIKDKMKRK